MGLAVYKHLKTYYKYKNPFYSHLMYWELNAIVTKSSVIKQNP